MVQIPFRGVQPGARADDRATSFREVELARAEQRNLREQERTVSTIAKGLGNVAAAVSTRARQEEAEEEARQDSEAIQGIYLNLPVAAQQATQELQDSDLSPAERAEAMRQRLQQTVAEGLEGLGEDARKRIRTRIGPRLGSLIGGQVARQLGAATAQQEVEATETARTSLESFTIEAVGEATTELRTQLEETTNLTDTEIDAQVEDLAITIVDRDISERPFVAMRAFNDGSLDELIDPRRATALRDELSVNLRERLNTMFLTDLRTDTPEELDRKADLYLENEEEIGRFLAPGASEGEQRQLARSLYGNRIRAAMENVQFQEIVEDVGRNALRTGGGEGVGNPDLFRAMDQAYVQDVRPIVSDRSLSPMVRSDAIVETVRNARGVLPGLAQDLSVLQVGNEQDELTAALSIWRIAREKSALRQTRAYLSGSDAGLSATQENRRLSTQVRPALTQTMVDKADLIVTRWLTTNGDPAALPEILRVVDGMYGEDNLNPDANLRKQQVEGWLDNEETRQKILNQVENHFDSVFKFQPSLAGDDDAKDWILDTLAFHANAVNLKNFEQVQEIATNRMLNDVESRFENSGMFGDSTRLRFMPMERMYAHLGTSEDIASGWDYTLGKDVIGPHTVLQAMEQDAVLRDVLEENWQDLLSPVKVQQASEKHGVPVETITRGFPVISDPTDRAQVRRLEETMLALGDIRLDELMSIPSLREVGRERYPRDKMDYMVINSDPQAPLYVFTDTFLDERNSRALPISLPDGNGAYGETWVYQPELQDMDKHRARRGVATQFQLVTEAVERADRSGKGDQVPASARRITTRVRERNPAGVTFPGADAMADWVSNFLGIGPGLDESNQAYDDLVEAGLIDAPPDLRDQLEEFQAEERDRLLEEMRRRQRGDVEPDLAPPPPRNLRIPGDPFRFEGEDE